MASLIFLTCVLDVAGPFFHSIHVMLPVSPGSCARAKIRRNRTFSRLCRRLLAIFLLQHTMHSHHSHSGQFCSHAHPGSTIEGMLSQASSMGFHTYCLSEHVPRQFENELYPEEVEEGSSPATLQVKFRKYLEEARRLQKKAQSSGKAMNVLVGAETENVSPQTLQWLKESVLGAGEGSRGGAFIGKGVVDYLVGSVHHAGAILPCCSSLAGVKPAVAGIPIDFDAGTFQRAREHFGLAASEASSTPKPYDLLRLCLSYFNAQYKLIDELRPEVIGHFDLIRLFAKDLKLYVGEGVLDEGQELTALRHEVEQASDRNIRLAASYGALFEVNSASVRKGWPSPYPGEEVLQVSGWHRACDLRNLSLMCNLQSMQRILQLGGRLCLSDDAHGPSHVAINYRESHDYLRSHKVDSIWYLTLDDGEETKEDADLESDEKARKAREISSVPGRNAPCRFARGTKAVKVDHWWQDAFWERLG